MIYLSEFENRILEITYGTGSGTGEMKVVVQRFMEEQTLVKIRKLLNIIRTSDNPEAEKVLSDFCKQWLSQYEIEQKSNANNHVAAKEKARKVEIDIIDLQRKRSNYKRNTEHYKQYTELLKQKREELSATNALARSYLTDFNRNQKMKVKFEKVMEFISQG